MDMKNFLEELERNDGKMLFEAGGKEGEKIDANVKAALKGEKYIWAYQPEGYDLVILEHSEDGEKPDSWSIAFFTEAEVGGEEEEDIYKEGLNEAKVGLSILDTVKGKFSDIIKTCMEIAENKGRYKSFTPQNIKQAVAKAKKQ